jgi:aldehyde dehydrogenase (NAD+)
MREYKQFYINGEWVEPSSPNDFAVLDPATEEVCATISLGNEADVDKAVAAAKAAFETFSQTSVEERVALLERMAEVYKRRIGEVAEAIRLEMGAPIKLASTAQAYAGLGHIVEAAKVLKTYAFEEDLGPHKVVKEPIGVCGLITPWNWPLNQVSCKVAPAIAVGCTMVLKPSEVAPLSAYLYAEIMHEAGVPAGVFNLVNGGHCTLGSPRCRYDVLYRIDPRWLIGGAECSAYGKKSDSGAGRQVTQYHYGRCGSGGCGNPWCAPHV